MVCKRAIKGLVESSFWPEKGGKVRLSWNERRHLTLLLLLLHPLPLSPPFFIVAVKCNPNYEVVRVLAMTPGCGFDCASPAEIDQVLACGVDPSRIIYANPCKDVAALEHALDGERRSTRCIFVRQLFS